MPELPEVETVARALRPHLVNRRIIKIETFTEALRSPVDLAGRPELIGRRIRDIQRRAKYIVVALEGGHCILLHLGMTGSCRIVRSCETRLKHEHVIQHLDDGWSWRFLDPRKFGRMEIHPLTDDGPLPPPLRNLAPEPLGTEFDAEYLRSVCKNRKRPIKSLLMDSGLVVGVGNIYASEALFRAGIHPAAAAGRLSKSRCQRLVRAITDVLQDAIDAGGTTISDFRTVDGTEGHFARKLDVYGRENEPCARCRKGRLKKTVTAGRSTYYCPRCQH